MSLYHEEVLPCVRRVAGRNLARLLFGSAGALLVVLAAGWLAPSTAQAGTITVVDGPNTPPVGGVYNDAYIQNHLAISGSLTISTTGVVTGPDEIRVLQSALITWTTGNTLTLDAGTSVVISGTIQHSGPTTGEGGLRLLASGDPNGAVIVGPGSQSTGVAAGSRFGLTRVEAGNLVLKGGSSGTNPYAQLGYRAFDKSPGFQVNGAISVTVSQNVTVTGGTASFAFAQIGHGGADSDPDSPSSGSFSGAVAVDVTGNATFVAGGGDTAYAQLGNGGRSASGNHSGGHSLTAGEDVTFKGGGGVTAYAQLGNGGFGAIGNHSGGHSLVAGGDVTFQRGSSDAYAQLGNGGYSATGNHSGGHSLVAGGDVIFQTAQLGNGGTWAYGSHSGGHNLIASGNVTFQCAQLGNGGWDPDGNHSGDHSLDAGGNVTFQCGGSLESYAQMGNGGFDYMFDSTPSGSFIGDHSLAADGNVIFQGAQFGNGGAFTDGDHSGDHGLTAGGDVIFRGDIGTLASAQLGNGGYEAAGNHSGGHSLVASGNVTFQGQGASAQLGNGGSNADGSHSGDHKLTAGGNVIFQGGIENYADAQLGNGGFGADGDLSGSLALTVTGSLSVTEGSGSDAYAMLGHGSDIRIEPVYQGAGNRAGDISVRAGESAVFNGAQVGHLTADGMSAVTQGNTYFGVSQNEPVIGTGMLLVTGVQTTSFASAPTGQLRFYIPRFDSQQIPISAAFNGQSFAVTNTIPIDRIQGFFLFGGGPYSPPYSFYVDPPATLTITKTVVGSAPPNAWQFSGSGSIGGFTLPKAGGSQSFSQLDAGTYTVAETAKQGYTSSVSCTNGQTGTNSVSVTLGLGDAVGCTFTNTAQPATLTITKTVVGATPGSVWQFTGSGSIGSFTLPKTGGSQSFSVAAGNYTIGETAKPNYTAAVSCTDGASGTNSVQVTLSLGSTTGCIFTNTFLPPVEITQTLTVQKVVVGGPLDADDFALLVDGLPVTRNVPKPLDVGSYTVSETSVSTYTASFGGACNGSGQVNLAAGAQVTCTITNTFEDTPPQPGAVEGIVFEDLNGNDQPDVDEGMAGVTVTLQSEEGVVAALILTDVTEVTDAEGVYGFADVPPGGYTLSFAVPAGYAALEDEQVTVLAGQTFEVPDQVAAREEPGGPGDVYLPVLQR